MEKFYLFPLVLAFEAIAALDPVFFLFVKLGFRVLAKKDAVLLVAAALALSPLCNDFPTLDGFAFVFLAEFAALKLAFDAALLKLLATVALAFDALLFGASGIVIYFKLNNKFFAIFLLQDLP